MDVATGAGLFAPRYGDSHAIVVGIDRYNHVSPLSQADNDARGVRDALVERLGFQDANVKLLLDSSAARASIMSSLLELADPDRVGPDDRVVFFFAGHGHTVAGRRGDTGFLIPYDGSLDDLSTLIRWDELTRNSELIAAKHVFFIMDACYGGLALKRRLTPIGGLRLLDDMMQRYARQVLTAGKPDQEVSDAGGVRPGHSIFTSHLLEALDGAAAATAGVITAAGVMAYVYDRVGNDPHSQQTPHYGTLDGDGDFIFAPLILDDGVSTSHAQLIQPAIIPRDHVSDTGEEFSAKIKRLLSNSSDRIALDSFVNESVRRFLQEASSEKFPRQGGFTPVEFAARLQHYETASNELVEAMLLLGRWAEPDQSPLVEKILTRATDSTVNEGGQVIWLNLTYYPVALFMYAAGIGALFRRDFELLRRVLLAPIPNRRGDRQPAVQAVFGVLTDIHDAFKVLNGFERRYTPRSDYIYQVLQTQVEAELFVGSDYERLFDEFEIFVALTYADVRGYSVENTWGPPGRFAWKARGTDENPLDALAQEAQAEGDSWPPLRAGFFKGSHSRFAELVKAYGSRIAGANWG